jgi:hypothetical protein
MYDVSHMPLFTIWREGFDALGAHGDAQCVAVVEAEDFAAACQSFFGSDPEFDRVSLTYWACRLYDDEAAARATFG